MNACGSLRKGSVLLSKRFISLTLSLCILNSWHTGTGTSLRSPRCALHDASEDHLAPLHIEMQ